jgi:dTDP-4-amino-4,6-dideoxygalactose transaminase
MKIPLAKPYYSEKDAEAVKKVLDSRWVAQGPTVEEFEEKISEYLDVEHAIAVNSCTSALHLSLAACDIGIGDEVIVSDFTFPATGNTILYTSAIPISVDIDLETMNINPELIKAKITDKTKVILPVDTFGNPVDMDPINEIANENDLKVIEDAACAIGAEYKNKKVGTLSDIASFSFHARKILSTGEGGIITTNNEDLAEKMKALRSHGMFFDAWDREQSDFKLPMFKIIGYNYRMSDITAAIGITQLEMLDQFITRRRELAKYYNDLFLESNFEIKIPHESNFSKHIYQSYVIILNQAGIRDKVIGKLQKNGIGCTIGFYSLSNLPLFEGNCPNSTEAFENSIALPMFFELTENEIDFVVNILSSIFEEF